MLLFILSFIRISKYMESFNDEIFETASHSDELDFLYEQNSDDIEKAIFDDRDFFHGLKLHLKLLRKNFSGIVRKKMQKNFTNIVYLTLDCPPYTPNSSRLDSSIDYINEMRNQYPENDIRVLIPIINVDENFRQGKKLTINNGGISYTLEKSSITFSFFLQNKVQEAIIYEYPKDKNNIQVYGIYCPSFSKVKNIAEFSKLQILAPFIKASRIAVKKLSKIGFGVDIVHTENIPFYLGEEFEIRLPYPSKILQSIRDFTLWDVAKTEIFWAAINLADKNSMKKICRDENIKKYIAELFNLHNGKKFYQMRECLDFIYKNYYKFRKYIDKGEEIEENFIFNKLNLRIAQLFPQISQQDKVSYNPMVNSIKRSDYWITTSKSYYNDVLENPKLSGCLYKYIEKSKDKSSYTNIGINTEKYLTENTRQVYFEYNQNNFREEKSRNKSALLKEFNSDRIKTNFIDPTLFKDSEIKVVGYLDSFYEAPLFFANLSAEIFAQGVDILFNTVLKLFEQHKNAQFIICIKDGLKNSFINNWIDFLSQNKYFNGKWIFIDGNINLPKFLSASDMILLPRRVNSSSPLHLIAMHYGCVPISSRCGMLNDTIADIFEDISNGCGFKTKEPLMTEDDNNEIFMIPVMKALNLYQNNPSSWKLLIRNCMNNNPSWKFKVLEKYDKIYKELM